MSEQRVVVMGLGNLLWADEGFGVRVAERLYAITTGPSMWRLSMAVLRD
ncbi:hydrogenase 1 maturation protease [Escherichia coli]|nr:hydrogenase 1 maturation protease [Escherichia coli]SRA20646.1 hydrogenase 1 maturation protease [Escherichia coli]SRA25478.1 hydrogenase 1 maturation protease [Escherichia coli]SRA41211.1 hydrogenase 1 maturation protease [Escherichia coli]SRA48606.1 hydrogenase 1 maturation protease [Escherichia coli]